jgi:GT2 family glycosyltransferase
VSETIFILLPVHNRRETTRRFINCLKKQTYHKYHLLLIDDGSTDGTEEMVRNEIEASTVIKGQGNWWWAGSLQQGYVWLKTHKPPSTDIVLMINDDTVFGPDFLEKAVFVLRKRPKTFLLTRCYSQQSGQLIDDGVHVDWKRFSFERPSTLKPINCLSTRGLFFRVEDLLTVGGLRPGLLPHYGSDYEFTIRAHRKGMDLATDPSLELRLDETATGYHQVDDRSILNALKAVFSRKSSINPITLSIFVALACPWPWKVSCWFRILARSFSHGWSLLMGQTPTR